MHQVQGLLDHLEFNEAYQRLLEDGSFLSRALAAGVRSSRRGWPSAIARWSWPTRTPRCRWSTAPTYLATVGTLGPMIGLVGTVYGMILSFRVIATEGSSPQASQLAAGISTAPFATLEGIALSIPAIYFYCAVPQPDRAAVAGGGDDRRAPARTVRAGAVDIDEPGAGTASAPSHPVHVHPFAVSAALAAASERVAPALPTADSSSTLD